MAGITELLIGWNQGDKGALDRLMPLVYEELRHVARRRLAVEDREHTLQSAALVNETYLRLVDQERVQWRNRAHFFAISARIMRRILVDHARQRSAAKRGGGNPKLSLDPSLGVLEQADLDVVALDEALDSLAKLDPQQARVIELRFFAGLTIVEVSEALGISPATVTRDWVTAKAWLFAQLNQAGNVGQDP
ncbi:MAG TPA: sigma-70 family RNA polymerase sigma factor [Bryobacteraceae bacterium]|nr:sigma-70 family RNA polymerase sigma factor [Bryobacteraceae bacterium]